MSGSLTEIQELGLAFGALYSEVYGLKHSSLRGIGSSVDDEFQQYIREIFESCWGIQTRDDLIKSLDWRFNYGDRSYYAADDGDADDIIAWDFCLLIHNARFGFLAGMLSEAETWEWLIKSAREMEHTFSSWKSFADSYLRGRSYWNALNVVNDERDEFDDAIDLLLDPNNGDSPWNKIKLTAGKNRKKEKAKHQKFTPAQWASIVNIDPAAGKDPSVKKNLK